MHSHNLAKLFPSIMVALIFITLATTALAEHTCTYCHQKIEAGWVEVDGQYYHPNHFVCTNCLKPISDPRFFEHAGKYYDSTCFTLFITKRCDYCGRPIIGETIYFDSKTYHASCYNESVGKRCVVCGNVAVEEFFVDNRGNAVCKAHKDAAARCHACQQFLSPVFKGSWSEYDDGRIICKQCDATAVHEISEARELIEEVKDELEAAGITIDQKFKLTFVSIQELNTSLNVFLVDHLGVTKYEESEILGGLFTSKKYAIQVLYGLPRSLLRSVLAHELMHVWLFANAPRPQDQQMCEGSCQYAAYLVLQNDDTDNGRYFLEYMMSQDDEIYGEGFQKVLGYINSVGLNPWLDYLQNNTDAPW